MVALVPPVKLDVAELVPGAVNDDDGDGHGDDDDDGDRVEGEGDGEVDHSAVIRCTVRR